MVRVQLEKIIEWQCHGHSERVRRVLDQRNLDSHQYPELLSRQLSGRQYFERAPTTQEQTLVNNWHASQLQIPPQSQDSLNGRTIQIRHVFAIANRWVLYDQPRCVYTDASLSKRAPK
jgi:hypothetical protein